jgi:hypothetical protein
MNGWAEPGRLACSFSTTQEINGNREGWKNKGENPREWKMEFEIESNRMDKLRYRINSVIKNIALLIHWLSIERK